MTAGDILRRTYNQLSPDPNSLANLDQDLPNYLQHNVGGYTGYTWLKMGSSLKNVCSCKVAYLYPPPPPHPRFSAQDGNLFLVSHVCFPRFITSKKHTKTAPLPDYPHSKKNSVFTPAWLVPVRQYSPLSFTPL